MKFEFRHVIVFWIICLFGHLVNAQQLNLIPIPYDGLLKNTILTIGISNDGRILLLDDQGKIHRINGSETEVLPIQIKDPRSIHQISASKNTIYLNRNQDLTQIELGAQEKMVEKNIGIGCFHFQNSKLFFQANLQCLQLDEKEIEGSEPIFPTCQSQYVALFDESFLSIRAQQILWKSQDDKLLFELNIQDSDAKIVQGIWNEIYLLDAGKLYSIEFLNHQKLLPVNFPVQRKCIQIFPQDQSIQVLFENDILFTYDDKQLSELHEFSELPSSYACYKHKNEYWFYTKNQLFLFQDNRLLTIDLPDYLINSSLVSIARSGTTLNVLTSEDGIIQAKLLADNQDVDWAPHPQNAQIKSLQFKKIDYWNQNLVGLSPMFGLAIIQFSEIQLKQLPTGKEQMESWFIKDQAIHIQTNQNQLFSLDDPQRQLQNIAHEWKQTWQWIQGKEALFILDNQQLFKIENNEVNYVDDIANDDIASKIHSSNSWIEDGNLYSIQPDGVFKQYLLSSNQEERGPNMIKVQYMTKKNKFFERSFPFSERDTIYIEESDWPIDVEVSSYYFKGSRNIQMAVLPGMLSSVPANTAFAYKQKEKLRYRNANKQVFTFAVKADEKIEYFVSPIFITKPTEAAENPWIWIYLCVGLLLIAIIYYITNRRKTKRHEAQIQALSLQNKTLELEQKSLQLQMNPHFIFNALNGIQGMIAMGENRLARQYIVKLSGLMRSMLDHSRSQVIPISEEISMLRLYMDIEKALHESKWDYEFSIEEGLDLDQKIPPMMIQPFLENAIKHAFKGVTYKGHITLKMNQKGRRLVCQVEDNGIGLSSEKNTNSKHKSVALDVIKMRLQLLNQGTQMEEFRIQNKADLDPKTSGVIVHIVIPII